jgi:defect-in-organelle-trafficking protein DotD
VIFKLFDDNEGKAVSVDNFVNKKIARYGCILALAAILPLAGCSGNPLNIKNAKPQLVAEPDKSSLMIADAADRATRALESLAAVEQVRTPSAAVASAAMVPNAPPELQKAVTFSWSGPAEDVARDMAARAGYTFRVVGDKPAAPILVNLDIYNQPMIEVFRDLGLQMGTRADLRLDASSRTVEIIYAPTVNRPTPNSGQG